MTERNLYEVTGDIKDINTLLVNREEWNRRAQPAQAVPMTDAQINDAYGEARVQHDHIPHDDVARIARSVEKHHGIVGKAGA